MWMLLEPPRNLPAPTEAERDRHGATLSPEASPSSGAPAAASSTSPAGSVDPPRAVQRANGKVHPATLLRSVSSNAPLRFTLYMHPGRACLGTTDVWRLREQFDVSQAKVFDSLAQAELAADGRVGFVVDVRGRFTDAHGRPRDRAALFFPRLRA